MKQWEKKDRIPQSYRTLRSVSASTANSSISPLAHFKRIRYPVIPPFLTEAKSRGAFTSENALIKLIYCAAQKVLEKWNQPMHNWALIVSQLQIYFEDRLTLGLR